jgi:membrane-associated phospholipid phosphatase
VPDITNHLKPLTARDWLLLSASMLLLVFAVHFWLVWVGSFPGDRWAAKQGHLFWTRPQFERDVVTYDGDLGSPLEAVTLVVVLFAWLWWAGGRRAAIGLPISCLAVVASTLLKHVFGATPLSIALHGPTASFPSGHVAFVTATLGYTGAVALARGQRWLAAIALALIVAIGPDRVISGAHVVSDVIGGYLLGAAGTLLAYAYLTRRQKPSRPRRPRRPQRAKMAPKPGRRA